MQKPDRRLQRFQSKRRLSSALESGISKTEGRRGGRQRGGERDRGSIEPHCHACSLKRSTTLFLACPLALSLCPIFSFTHAFNPNFQRLSHGSPAVKYLLICLGVQIYRIYMCLARFHPNVQSSPEASIPNFAGI